MGVPDPCLFSEKLGPIQSAMDIIYILDANYYEI